MKLKKLFDRIFYFPYESDTDRPALVYICGDKFSLAIDAGNSKKHVEEFYNDLREMGLRLPDFTLLTHWHWDHTFGMNYVHGCTIALEKTNEYLKKARENFENPKFLERVREENEFFRTEYGDEKVFQIVESDISFSNNLKIDLGGVSVLANKIDNPHTDDHLLIHIPDAKLIVLGDASGEDAFNFGFGNAFMDGKLDEKLMSDLINTIWNIDFETCILSHVDIVSKAELIHEMKLSIINENFA